MPYDSRAVRFGFGLFETMLVIDGEIQLKQLHWDRLFSSIKALKLVVPELMTREWVEEEILKTVSKNNMQKLCRVRMQVYAGRGGLFDGQSAWSEFIIESQFIEQGLIQLNTNGFQLIIAQGLAKSTDDMANMKITNAMIYALGARQAQEKKADNALILNTHGNVIETTLANIFCIKGDTIYTPPLSEGCIAGVMRRFLMDQLAQKGFKVEKQPFTIDFLKSADSVFVTNAIRRIKWIARIEEKEYNIGKILDVYEQVQYK